MQPTTNARTMTARPRNRALPVGALAIAAVLAMPLIADASSDGDVTAGAIAAAPPSVERVESSGYESPDAAAGAYAAALAAGDLDGAMSTFAVETLAERFDLAAWIERLGAYSRNTGLPPLPNTDPFNTALNIETRRARVADEILLQLFVLADVDFGEAAYMHIRVEEPDEFVDDLAAATTAAVFAGFADATPIALADVDAEVADRLLHDEFLVDRRAELAATLGADELAPAALRATMSTPDGPLEITVLFDAVRYGDSWWLLGLGGDAALLLGLSAAEAGVLVDVP